MRLYLSAGEASGDTYAASLVRAFSRAGVPVEPEGVGGRRLRATGAKMHADCTKWAAIGIVEAARVAPRVVLGLAQAKLGLRLGPPGVFIPIDFGFVNVGLARQAKKLGWKVLYFIPPGSWRRTKQGSDIPTVSDLVVTPFEWSADILRTMGAEAHWFGHPLRQIVREALTEAKDRNGLAVLPGSRRHEIETNLPVIAEAVRGLPGPVRMSVAPSVDPRELLAAWKRLSAIPVETCPTAAEALSRSMAAIVCSGTATLEAALCRCPCVVMYRGGKLMELEYRIRRPKFTYISLPNILLDRPVLAELIQWDATPEAVRDHVTGLLKGPAREAQLAAFAELEPVLGPSDAIDRTVQLVRERWLS